MSRRGPDPSSAPLSHFLTDEEEERLTSYLIRGEACSIPIALEAMTPPWCDASRGIQCLGASWDRLTPLPSSDLVDLLKGVQEDPALEHVMSAAEIAEFGLTHAADEHARAPFQDLLPQLMLAQAWLNPFRLGADWASYAACRYAMSGGDPQLQLRIGVSALSFLLCTSERMLRGVISTKEGNRLFGTKRQRGLEGLEKGAAQVWKAAGLAAGIGVDYLDLPLDSDFGSVTDLSSGPGPTDVLAARFDGSVAEGFENWLGSLSAADPDGTDPRVEQARAVLGQDGRPMIVRLRAASSALHPHAAETEPLVPYRQLRRDVVAWLALTGDGPAALECAALAVCEALGPRIPGERQARGMGLALGYLQLAAATSPLALLDGSTSHGVPDLADLNRGGALRLIRSAQNAFLTLTRRAEWDDAAEGRATLPELWRDARNVPRATRDHLIGVAKSEHRRKDQLPGTVVVIPSLPKASGGTGRDIERDWRHMVGVGLPLVRTPDLQEVFRSLVAALPHLRAVIDRLLSNLVGQQTVLLRPTLLVGPPGAGKTFLARSLAELLGLPSIVYPAGGVADSSLIGTSRQWSTGRPSVALGLVRTTQKASVMVIIDELEKAGRSQTNGRIEDGLLALWETATSRNFFDLLLEVPVDLSHVSWIATANSISGISSPLLDRLRVLHVPAPEADDLLQLLPGTLDRIRADRLIPKEWMMPLEPWEVAAIERAWRPRSLRLLRKLVEAALDARARGDLMH